MNQVIDYVEVYTTGKSPKLVAQIGDVISFAENEHSYSISVKEKKKTNKIIYSKPEHNAVAVYKLVNDDE